MNKTIPYRNPFCTIVVWWPWYVPSRTMSRHHWYIVKALVRKLSVNSVLELKWNHMIRPEVSRRAESAPVRGQGLGFTM
mgnify:CR=1